MESRVQPHPQTDGRDKESFPAAKILAPYLILSALVLAAVFPFASRAIYLDEPQYLHVANSALTRDWRFPQDVPWVFYGRLYPNLAPQAHPPVVEYYLAVLLKILGGFHVRAFRLLYAVFPLLAVCSFYRLARRFTASPLLVSSLFAVSPAFFVLSPTLMMDIPMLSFLLTGISLYLDALDDRGRRSRLWLASLFFILALGTGYTVLIPLGCLFLWALASRRSWRECLAIATAPAAIVIWLTLMTWHFGEIPTNELARYYTSHFSFSELVFPLLSFAGGVAFFPVMVFAFVEPRTAGLVALISTVSASLLTLLRNWPSLSYRLWFIFLATAGIALLMIFAIKALAAWTAMIKSQRQPPTAFMFLVLWFPATLLFFLLFAEMISARYLLLSFPPLFLVVCHRIRQRTAAIALLATASLSVSLAVGDYRFVNAYPQWVAETIVPLQRQGFRAWNAGESGLRFYLQKEGIETLQSTDIRPRGGELIVKQESFNYGLSNELAPLLVGVHHDILRDEYPVRTFSRGAGAGFHDSHFGIVPYTFSRVPLDRLEITEVSPFVLNLPQTVPSDFSSVPVWSPTGVILKQVDSRMVFSTRLPKDTTVKYDLHGEGTVTLLPGTIILEKTNPGPAIWQNFRIVPNSFLVRNDGQ